MILWTVPLSAFGLFLLVHVVVWRLVGARGVIGLWPLCALAIGAYGVVSLAGWGVFGVRGGEPHWVTMPIFAFLTMCYLHFYYGVLRSVSVRVMGELVKYGGGPIRLDVLQRAYSYEELMAVRLASLVRAGWIAEQNGQCRLLPRGRRVARLADWLKRLYRLEVSG